MLSNLYHWMLIIRRLSLTSFHCTGVVTSESCFLHNVCDGTIPDIYTPLIRLQKPFTGHATLTVSIVMQIKFNIFWPICRLSLGTGSHSPWSMRSSLWCTCTAVTWPSSCGSRVTCSSGRSSTLRRMTMQPKIRLRTKGICDLININIRNNSLYIM